MTPEQIFLVQSTFAILRPRVGDLVATFYDRLFAADPSLRAMFPDDMTLQRQKLVAALIMAAQALSRPQPVLPVLQDRGRRHAAYGVHDGHYALAGAALLGALREHLGEAFDADVEAAWTAAYERIVAIMQDAARAAAA